MLDELSKQICESVEEWALSQDQARRVKRRFSALINNAEDPQLPSERHRRVTQSKVSEWLETIPSPPHHLVAPFSRKRSYSASPSRPVTTASKRSRSAPARCTNRSYAAMTPPSSRASMVFASTQSISSKATSLVSQVRMPLYRQLNLETNGVYLRLPNASLPHSIEQVMERLRVERVSPPPDLAQWDPDLMALELGKGETEVEAYFKDKVFVKQHDPAFRSDKKSMFRAGLPQDSRSQYQISQPVPDIAYGYTHAAFAEFQWIQVVNMGKNAMANNEGLVYPFFVVEMKADGPHGGGSLWAATNQCLGGASLCAKLASELYHRLCSCSDYEVQPCDSAVFSIALSGTEARLYITWSEDNASTYTQKVGHYLIQRPDEMIEFRKTVLNIIDWGRTKRLQNILDALDQIRGAQVAMKLA